MMKSGLVLLALLVIAFYAWSGRVTDDLARVKAIVAEPMSAQVSPPVPMSPPKAQSPQVLPPQTPPAEVSFPPVSLPQAQSSEVSPTPQLPPSSELPPQAQSSQGLPSQTPPSEVPSTLQSPPSEVSQSQVTSMLVSPPQAPPSLVLSPNMTELEQVRQELAAAKERVTALEKSLATAERQVGILQHHTQGLQDAADMAHEDAGLMRTEMQRCSGDRAHLDELVTRYQLSQSQLYDLQQRLREMEDAEALLTRERDNLKIGYEALKLHLDATLQERPRPPRDIKGSQTVR